MSDNEVGSPLERRRTDPMPGLQAAELNRRELENARSAQMGGGLTGRVPFGNGDEQPCIAREVRSETTEVRLVPRIAPLHRDLEGRIVLTGTILDISLSGAAIRLGNPEGAFVGERFAITVRTPDDGLAVHYVVPLTSENFDERVRL